MSHGYMKLFIRSFLVCPVFTSSFYKRIFFSEFLILNLKKVYKKGNFMIKNEELPIGFTMELAQHTDILNLFAQLPEERRNMIIEGARDMHSREEMRNYVENICG